MRKFGGKKLRIEQTSVLPSRHQHQSKPPRQICNINNQCAVYYR
uniref:Uncharacterized protein n=1 Tax=Anguilla anguilla TaxID=7936 RepID=A0A0E9X7W5_ANGAN